LLIGLDDFALSILDRNAVKKNPLAVRVRLSAATRRLGRSDFLSADGQSFLFNI